MDIDKSILNDIKSKIIKNKQINDIILFGSRAKGNAKEGSDIDIAIVGDNISFSDLCEIKANIEELNLPYKLDIINYDKISNNKLKQHIDKVGIRI